MSTINVLVVDDDEDIIGKLNPLLADNQQFNLIHQQNMNSTDVLDSIERCHIQVVLLDLFDGNQDVGGGILQQIQRYDTNNVKVIILSVHVTPGVAEHLREDGAFDVLKKEDILDKRDTVCLVEKIIQAANTRDDESTEDSSQELDGVAKILQKNSAAEKAYREAKLCAAQNISILLLGKTGTGKSFLAQYIHKNSLLFRLNGLKLEKINIGAFPQTGNVLETELFGHDHNWPQGGPSQARLGVFLKAAGYQLPPRRAVHTGIVQYPSIMDIARHNGDEETRLKRCTTLFLDEIGDAAGPVQTALLFPVEDKVVHPLGMTHREEIPVKGYRLICATRHPIDDWVLHDLQPDNHHFRPDLFYRIAHVTITLPTLEAMGAAVIQQLAEYYCQKFWAEYNPTSSMTNITMKTDDMNLLIHYTWPGNLRELEHAMREAVIFSCAIRSNNSTIELRDVRRDFIRAKAK